MRRAVRRPARSLIGLAGALANAGGEFVGHLAPYGLSGAVRRCRCFKRGLFDAIGSVQTRVAAGAQGRRPGRCCR